MGETKQFRENIDAIWWEKGDGIQWGRRWDTYMETAVRVEGHTVQYQKMNIVWCFRCRAVGMDTHADI